VHSDHVPTGHETKIHAFDTYIAEPPNGVPPKGIIVIVPDAFGWQFVNNKLLADHYASKGGFKVYLPDFMDGTAAPVWMIDSMAAITKSGATIWENLQKP
jgi:dienelactone hydrolase